MENLSLTRNLPDKTDLVQIVLQNQAKTDEIMKEVETIYQKIDKISSWISTRFGASLFETTSDSEIEIKSTDLDIPNTNIHEKFENLLSGSGSNVLNALNHNNDHMKTQCKKSTTTTTLLQRSLQIRASMRKRRVSSLSQGSTVNRYIIRKDIGKSVQQEQDIDFDSFSSPTEAHTKDKDKTSTSTSTNGVSVIVQVQRKCQNVDLEVEAASKSKSCETQAQSISISPGKTSPISSHPISYINTNRAVSSPSSSTQNQTPNYNQKRGRPKKSPQEKVRNYRNLTPMVCDQCGKVLKGPSSLKSHKLCHSDIRNYKCHKCSKSFRMKHHLEFHLLTHEGDKKWTCRFCHRGFIAQRDLMRHERTHTGERPYACTFPNCPKSFNVKQHLTLHFRTHTGERPYKCPICEKTFTQANSLRIHKKIHVKGI